MRDLAHHELESIIIIIIIISIQGKFEVTLVQVRG